MDYIYIQDERHIKDRRPLSPFCDCLTCSHYSVGYMHHLFKINDSAFYRLATIHNLRFMVQLCQRLRLRQAGPISEETAVEDPKARRG